METREHLAPLASSAVPKAGAHTYPHFRGWRIVMGELGALTALGPAGRNSRNEPISRYRCDCGTEVVRVAATITGKRLHSCGCKLGSWAKGRSNLATRKHGMSRGAGVKGHPLYTVWIAMKQR